MATRALLDEIVAATIPRGLLQAAERVPGGNFTDVFRLQVLTPTGAVSLAARLFPAESTASLAEKHVVLLPLIRAAGLAAPELVWADVDGNQTGRPCVVLRWIDGTSFETAPDAAERVVAAATWLAALHELPPPVRRDWVYPVAPPDDLREWVSSNPRAGPILELLKSLKPGTQYQETLVHGDYWSGNLIWRDGTLAGVIDWDRAGTGDRGSDVAKTRLDLALHAGIEAAEAFTRAYAERRELSTDQPFWNLREAIGGFPDPGRYWLPTYRALGCTGIATTIIRERFDRYLEQCLHAVGA